MSDAQRPTSATTDPATPAHEATSGVEDAAVAVPADGAVEDAVDAGHLDVPAPAEDPRSRDELLVELHEAEARRDEYLDDVRRARAEFENYRRRVMREGATQREAGRADVLESLLDVLDDLDRTLAAADGSQDTSLAKGVELVAGKFAHALQGVGLERIADAGVAFDPTVHEAVQQQPADEPRDEPVVASVLRPGYRAGDRILRAAMVVVEQ